MIHPSMKPEQDLVPIPQPKPLPLFGNIFLIEASEPSLSLMRLSEKYGPIYKLNLVNRESVFIFNFAYFNEICDETRFQKSVGGILKMLHDGLTGDGLLTTATTDPNWRKAHNILVPCFSQRAMERYFAGMLMTTEQLISLWKKTPDRRIDVTADMTLLSLETLGVCGFDYDFNLLSGDDVNPFISTFSWVFETMMRQVVELPFERQLRIFRGAKLRKKMAYINDTVDLIIRNRRELGPGSTSRSDMLSYMLWGVDEQTGEKLDDVNIRQQVITFITVGHNTIAGLISFMLYALMANPTVLAQAQEEVDRVLGTDPTLKPTYEKIHQLNYLHRVLKETLRLWPVYPALLYEPIADTVIGGKYLLTTKNKIFVGLSTVHRDPAIWGPDAEIFNPDHFLPEAEAARPANAYKPFGSGMRACIARDFSVQQTLLVVSMILQNFKLIDLGYQLKIKEVNIFKPDNFIIKVAGRMS